jgi:hypothetical protein
MDVTELLARPVIEYGFLGFSMVLLGIIVWLIRRLLVVLERNTEVVALNTSAINTLTTMTADLLVLNRSLHDKIISRPCIAQEE